MAELNKKWAQGLMPEPEFGEVYLFTDVPEVADSSERVIVDLFKRRDTVEESTVSEGPENQQAQKYFEDFIVVSHCLSPREFKLPALPFFKIIHAAHDNQIDGCVNHPENHLLYEKVRRNDDGGEGGYHHYHR
jgi:hypothetical protein